MSAKIRILIVDDHQIFRECLAELLSKEQDFEVIGQAENGRTALETFQKLTADVVVMDVGMAGLNGIEATRQMLALAPNLKIIGLSMHSDRRFIAGMLQAGAFGYLLKECAFRQLSSAIRAVQSADFYLGGKVLDIVVRSFIRQPHGNNHIEADPLSDREREVLQLISEGNSTTAISKALHISVKTAETHRRNIMGKLKLYSVAELTKYAIQRGLTFLDV